ncbi:hypothetical protein [Streptomyces sp. KL116D]|uniref:hypothetical protein n=1 Tax=Streptomyces sp. KL116D TaxID=3045152 RepID=UPI0035584336
MPPAGRARRRGHRSSPFGLVTVAAAALAALVYVVTIPPALPHLPEHVRCRRPSKCLTAGS